MMKTMYYMCVLLNSEKILFYLGRFELPGKVVKF